MRVLITGVTGMAGSHLAEYLLTLPDVEVFGLYRWRSRMENLDDLRQTGALEKPDPQALGANADSQGKLRLIEADLTDASSMRRAIEAIRPDRIFHLAAQSYVPFSWSSPAATFQANVLGQINLLEAVVGCGLHPLIQIAGSSEEYGFVRPDEGPITESHPLQPSSPYAVSKVTQELLALQYHRTYGVKTIVTRGFNHTGPRQSEVFVCSSFAKQIAEIESEARKPVILTGDLDSIRDFSDVRDVVRAYWLALERGEAGQVYNIGNGRGQRIREMLNILLRMTQVQVEVQTDPARLRPSDIWLPASDSTKFRERTGWEPRIPFETTLKDILNYWRERV